MFQSDKASSINTNIFVEDKQRLDIIAIIVLPPVNMRAFLNNGE